MVLGLVVLGGWYCTLKWLMGCCFWLLRFRLGCFGCSGGVLDLGVLVSSSFGCRVWFPLLVEFSGGLLGVWSGVDCCNILCYWVAG